MHVQRVWCTFFIAKKVLFTSLPEVIAVCRAIRDVSYRQTRNFAIHRSFGSLPACECAGNLTRGPSRNPILHKTQLSCVKLSIDLLAIQSISVFTMYLYITVNFVIALLEALQCRMVEDNRYSCSPDFSPLVSTLDFSTYLYTCCVTRWSLCKAATSLKQPASLVPDSTKALESTSVEQPPLYNGQLELAHRRLS